MIQCNVCSCEFHIICKFLSAYSFCFIGVVAFPFHHLFVSAFHISLQLQSLRLHWMEYPVLFSSFNSFHGLHRRQCPTKRWSQWESQWWRNDYYLVLVATSTTASQVYAGGDGDNPCVDTTINSGPAMGALRTWLRLGQGQLLYQRKQNACQGGGESVFPSIWNS